MLAKELKIKTLKKQREFIEEQLSHADRRDDGNTVYWYWGEVYPENVKYFEKEGFRVIQKDSDLLTAKHNGMTLNIFTVGDIELSEEELKQAEAYEPEKSEAKAEADDIEEEFLKILGIF